MPLQISNKLQPPTISAVQIPEGGVKLSILGDIGDLGQCWIILVDLG